MVDRKLRTTIAVDEELWKRFSEIVLRTHGFRKTKSEVVEELIREFVERHGGGQG